MLKQNKNTDHVIFDARWIWYGCAIAIYFIVLYLPLEGFTNPGKHALAVFAVAAFLWITNIFPIAVTGIVVLFMLPLTGDISANTTYSYFGNSAVFFVLGAFILASPVMRSGLSTRIAITIISKFGKGPKRLLFSIFLLSSLLAFIISEHAVAAMLFPIILEIIKAAESPKGSRFAFAAFMAMAWGSMVGGTATLLGGARAPLAIGILQTDTDKTISFIQWTTWTLPAVVIILAVCFCVLMFLIRGSTVNIELARAKLLEHKSKLGPLSKRELYTILILLFTITLWISYGTAWGLDWIALLGVILAFALKITNWREVEEDVKWGIFIMYGSAIALSASLRDTGAAHSLVQMLLQTGISSPLIIFTVLALLAIILTEIMSNAAAVAVLMPMGLALGFEFGIDPRAIAVGIATCAGLTFVLPVSTPAMAIVTSCSYVNRKKAMLWGIFLKIIAFGVFMGTVLIYWPMVGLSLVN